MSYALSDTLSVDLAVVCEDVREEVGKKLSLMGVFSGDIIVAEMPATVRIAFYFAIHANKPGTYNMKVRFLLDDSAEPVFQGDGTINVDPGNKIGNLVFPNGFMQFKEDTNLRVQLAAKEENWVEVISKRVSKGAIDR